MDITLFFLLFFSFFGFIVFVLLFGESASLRHSFIGKLNRILLEKVPGTISHILLVTIGRNSLIGNKWWIYCCETRNPFLQIFFVGLSSISVLGFLHYALPHIPGPFLGKIHLGIIPIQIVSIYAVYYVACTSDPGIITTDNLQKHLDYYPYDGLIFKPKQCGTCKFQKPARSKHCSMCKACVGRSDHHCSWINHCVGENNQRYFFLFLFTLVEFCAYGAYLCFQVYRGFIIEWGLDKAFVLDRKTGKRSLITFRRAFLFVLHQDRVIGSIGILAAVVSAVVFIFFIYQVYLAARGITTNESFKWEFIEEAIYRGEIYKVLKKPQDTSHSSSLKSSNTTIKRKNENEEVEERRIKSFDEIENIYDKGFLGNLKEVFVPPRF